MYGSAREITGEKCDTQWTQFGAGINIASLCRPSTRDVAWEVGFKNGRVITTVILDAEQFERGPMSESTLVENIHRQGIAA